MADPGEYRSVLGGEPREVDVVTIEQELTQLWKAAADDTLEGQPAVRACVMNLVAFAPDQAAADHIDDVIVQTSGRHPSRAIVIIAQPGEPGRLRASISAHCQVPPGGGKQVCSEQITLRASAPAVQELHGTVLPLLVPDLPVFLWWHDEPDPDGHLFRELLENSDHLAVDSADFAPERAGAAISRLRRLTREAAVVLSDLNWSRLTPWRELVAQFFDAPPGRDYLQRLDRVSVKIASIHGRDPDLTEGLLVVGWLASRLGWRLGDGVGATGGALAFKLEGGAGPVAVELTPDPGHPGEGLHALSLRAGDEAAFSVARKHDDEGCVLASAKTPDGEHSRVVQVEIPSEAALLCEQLDALSEDPVFDEALDLAARLMERA